MRKKIIGSIGFNRLHDVYQNSTVFLTFPSNRTKRFEHSIGTMKLCSDMFFYSIANTEQEVLDNFFNLCVNKYNDMLSEIKKDLSEGKGTDKISDFDLNSLPNDYRISNIFIPSNVKKENIAIYSILIQALRAAALLHDVGHPPFSHIVEFAMRDVYATYSKKEKSELTDRSRNYLKIMEPFFNSENELHEEMGIKISDSILKEIIKGSRDEADEILSLILIQKTVYKMYKDEEGIFFDLHKIVANSIDGDRLDYVTRDSMNSGMKTGSIDYKRIILDMRVVISKDGNSEKVFFCSPVKSINAVEDVFIRRFNLYKTIINHHRVVKTDSLLYHSVFTLISEYLDDAKEACAANDEESIPDDISGLWFPLKFYSDKAISVSLSQWNDAWLMTLLRKIFYRKYYKLSAKTKKSERILKNQLTELLLNQRKYKTLVKRCEDFRVIDDKIKSKICENKEQIGEKLVRFESSSQQDAFYNNMDNGSIDFSGACDFIKK